MSKLKFKKLGKLLKNNKLISSSIADNLYAMENIGNFLEKSLPDEVLQHCFPLQICDRELVLMVDSPAWKSKLRFLKTSLEQQLQKESGGRIRSIRVTIQPIHPQPKNPISKPDRHRHLSEGSRAIISAMADSVDDPELREALLNLSRTKTQNNDA